MPGPPDPALLLSCLSGKIWRIYQAAIEDWETLGALYRVQGLLPVRYATEMSADDLKLAALVDEPPAHSTCPPF